MILCMGIWTKIKVGLIISIDEMMNLEIKALIMKFNKCKFPLSSDPNS